ncbi:fimbrial protein [Ewingella americana]
MFRKLYFILLFSIPGFFVGGVNAEQIGTVNVYTSFTITPTSCTIAGSDFTFNFYINEADLAQADSATDWKDMPGKSIRLINCFGGVTAVGVTVSGTMDELDKDGFKNMATGDTVATGLSVELKSGTKVLHNLDVIEGVMSDDNSIDIPLSARLYTTKGSVTPGDVYAIINLTMTYK